jgi:methyl coenzyme M reductase beta subunit
MVSSKSQLNPGDVGRKMDAMTREEMDARLEAAEARSETRFVELSGKLDRLGEILTGDHGVLSQMNSLRVEVKADYKATRWTIMITMISSILAAAALVMSVQANLLSAFQTGQAVGSSILKPR